MEERQQRGSIPPGDLRDGLGLRDVDALLRAHGASIRSVDNHHWQISRGNRSGVWLLGDGGARGGACLDPAALARLQGVLRRTGLLQEQEPAPSRPGPMAAAILWVGNEATRVYWINQQGLSGEGAQSIRHWLHGEITLHREHPAAAYLRRIVAMLERIDRALLIGRSADALALAARGRNGGTQAAGDHAAMVPAPADQVGVIPHAAAAAVGWPPQETSRPGDGVAEPEGLTCLTRLLEQERPDLRSRVVAILTLDKDWLDDALLFAMAQKYLHPQAAGLLR